MRKALMVLATAGLAIIASLAIVATASANAGPHGGYSIQTTKCAACHRAHTAVGSELLREATVYDLCVSCHGGAGGATTDVLNGVQNGNGRMNGGGFLQYAAPPVAGDATFTWGAPRATTSAHNVEGLSGGTGIGTAWGGAQSGTGLSGTLECTSCHNPHGSVNYRLLRDTVNGYPYGQTTSAMNQHRWVSDTVASSLWWNWSFDASGNITATLDAQVAETPGGGGNYTSGNVANYTGGIRLFCSTCHRSYLTKSGSAGQASDVGTSYYFTGTQDALDGKGDIARYRHATSRQYPGAPQYPVRFAATDATGATKTEFVCTSCHFAHGTSAVNVTGWASTPVAPTLDSALMYYDGRGICNSCHQKGK